MRRDVAFPMEMLARRRVNVERARVAAEILAAYCAARWWLLRLSFPDAVAAARKPSRNRVRLLEDDARWGAPRLGAAVGRLLRLLPVDSRCLVTSLVLTRLLARRGIESTFVLGVRTRPAFAAHAWVERNGAALLPTDAGFQRLAEL